jgi:hypothetical protein
MKKTVAYCRTAFAEPSDPFAGVSAQAASLREYAGQHGMTMDGTYNPGHGIRGEDRAR